MIKISHSDGLPTNICHRCLYHTEQFSDFCESIRQCESRLQKYVTTNQFLPHQPTLSDNIAPKTAEDLFANPVDDDYQDGHLVTADIKPYPADQPLEIVDDNTHNKIVLVVDPTKEYASSSDEDEDAGGYDDMDASDDEMGYDEQMHQTSSNANDDAADLAEQTAMMMPDQTHHHIPRLHLPVAETAEGFKNLFFCQFCDTAYVDQEDCFDHESSHDAVNPHQCNFCAFSCANRNSVVAHIKECHEPEKPFICVMCEKRFGRRSDLRKHAIVHTGIRPFGCPVCGKNFSRNTNLTKHLRIHSGLKPHVCQLCPRSFTTRADLLRHTQVHSEIKPFQCSQCPATYSRRYKFLHHEKTHHGVQNYQDLGELQNGADGGPEGGASDMMNGSGGDFDDGEEETRERYDSENMVISLDPFTDLNANTEEERAVSPHSVANSNHLDHLEPPAVTLPSKSDSPLLSPVAPAAPNISTFVFQDHIQEITFPGHVTGDAVTFLSNPPPTKPKKFACDHCPKRFATQSSLQNHKNIHLGVRNHVCSVCQKCFVRKRELDRHSVIHTGHKPFACVHCPKRFGRKDKLVRHERIHMEEKMFACTTCPMTFNRRDGLLLHMRTHLKHEEAAMNLLIAQQQHHHQQLLNQSRLQPQLLPPALSMSSIPATAPPPPPPSMLMGLPPHLHEAAQMYANHHHASAFSSAIETPHHHHHQPHQLHEQSFNHQLNYQQHHLPPTQLLDMKQEFFS